MEAEALLRLSGDGATDLLGVVPGGLVQAMTEALVEATFAKASVTAPGVYRVRASQAHASVDRVADDGDSVAVLEVTRDVEQAATIGPTTVSWGTGADADALRPRLETMLSEAAAVAARELAPGESRLVDVVIAE